MYDESLSPIMLHLFSGGLLLEKTVRLLLDMILFLIFVLIISKGKRHDAGRKENGICRVLY